MLFIRAILLSLMIGKHSTPHMITRLFLYVLVTAVLTHFLHHFFILDFNYTNVLNTVIFLTYY